MVTACLLFSLIRRKLNALENEIEQFKIEFKLENERLRKVCVTFCVCHVCQYLWRVTSCAASSYFKQELEMEKSAAKPMRREEVIEMTLYMIVCLVLFPLSLSLSAGNMW